MAKTIMVEANSITLVNIMEHQLASTKPMVNMSSERMRLAMDMMNIHHHQHLMNGRACRCFYVPLLSISHLEMIQIKNKKIYNTKDNEK